jgi:hypothetical protein
MKSITKILALTTLFVAGCSANRCYWYQPDKTFKQARQDCRDCYSEALNDELKVDVAYESSRHLSVYDRDPEYRPDFDDVITLHEFNLQNATRGCMKRKGYRLTRASELGSEVRRKTTCAFGECFPIAGR